MDVMQTDESHIIPPHNLNSEKIKYLLLEAFEVAFIKCNHENKNYNFRTILEMVKNIIPTAFVFGSSYWVFYKRGNQQQFCVCPNYGLKCKHIRVTDDWLEIPNISDDGSWTFIDRTRGFISLPTNFILEFQAEKMPNMYLIIIKTSLHLYKLQNGEYQFSRATPPCRLGIKFRITPLEENDLSITSLEPNPCSLQYYGNIFQVLKENNIYTCREGYVKRILKLGISQEHLPRFTLVPLKYFIRRKLNVKERKDITILNYCSYCLEEKHNMNASTQVSLNAKRGL